MASFDTLQTIGSRVAELTQKLTDSKLSKEELEELETLSRKLFERALILNYKAKEESVYGETSEKEEAMDATFPFAKEEKEETPSSIEEEVETKPSSSTSGVEKEEEEVEQKAKKDTPEEKETPTDQKNGGVEFDFSGGFGTPKPEQQEEQKTSVVEEQSEEVKTETEKSPKEAEVTQAETTSVEEENAIDEQPSSEEKPAPSLNELLQEENKENDSSSYYEHFLKSYNAAVGDKLSTSKINSLKDAIGLNDKLQFISELFGGDADRYNESLDQLDQLENSESALKELSEIAAQENWNKKDASVEEFAHLITRRYVE